MRLTAVLFFYLLCSSVVSPAVAQSLGTDGILSASGGSQTVPALVYNIVDAPFSATCDGTTDDAPAFNTWNATALAAAALHNQPVVLNLPSGRTCGLKTVVGNSQNFTQGFKDLTIEWNTATLSDYGGSGFFLGGGISAGISQANAGQWGHIATVAAGATSIVLTDLTKCSKWSVNDRATLTGGDLAGFGFPQTPYVWEYPKILSKATCAIDGTLVLTTPLKHSYKSTWPAYNLSDPPYQGGPATLYAYDNQYWDTKQTYNGPGTITQAGTFFNNVGRDITYNHMVFTTAMGIPSQNETYTCNYCTFGIFIEVDKINGTVNYDHSTFTGIAIQSPGADALNISNSTVAVTINGTVRGPTTITNSTIANLSPGAYSYGASGTLVLNNNAINGFSYRGVTALDVNLSYPMAGGVITIASNRTFSAAANNGSGAIRLTVSDTTDYASGFEITIGGAGATACLGSNGGQWVGTVIDGTHIDLVGSTFTATCSGVLSPGVNQAVNPVAWAKPGANIVWSGTALGFTGQIWQVTDITQTATATHVATSLPGGYPVVPLGTSQLFVPATAAFLNVHPAPLYSGTGNTGDPAWVDANYAGAQGQPFGSHFKRTLTAANCAPVSPVTPVFGTFVSLTIAVTTAFTGVSALNVDIDDPFIQSLGSAAPNIGWNPTVNAKLTGTRQILPASASGAQSGDSLALPSPGTNTWLTSLQISPECSANISGSGDPFTATVEFIVNQGAVFPPSP